MSISTAQAGITFETDQGADAARRQAVAGARTDRHRHLRGALAIGIGYAAFHLISDLSHVHTGSIFPFVLLGSRCWWRSGSSSSMAFTTPPTPWRPSSTRTPSIPTSPWRGPGCWNFLGVLVSTGGVAFGIVSLLPVELILKVGAGAGFAMVFALLTAAIIWNLGTWYFGLPSSSSHTLIGSIIGVGLANELMAARTATSGVDWGQASKIGRSLLISPLVGFVSAALLLLLMRVIVKNRKLYQAPEGVNPPRSGSAACSC